MKFDPLKPKIKITKMKGAIFTIMFLFQFPLFAQDWQPDFHQALEIAKTQDKDIILVFSGSDWCAPCIKLDKGVWQSDAFKSYSSDHWVLYKADFPRKKSNQLSEDLKAANEQLFEKYNKANAFPAVIVLNKKGEILGVTGYLDLAPEDYIAHLTSFEN